jgi:hypothetical protein
LRLDVACTRVAWIIALTLAAAPAAAQSVPATNATLEAHVLARTGYGADAWSRKRMLMLGVNAYLEEQLHPQSIPDDELEARLAGYSSLGYELSQLLNLYRLVPKVPLVELSRARVLRAVLSHRQLEQQLVDLWYDHFNVCAPTGITQSMSVVPYERAAIRRHVLGRFEDMLRAVARSPAMLLYLDNFLNVKEGFSHPTSGRKGINENYARELLELHTVGREAGFSQTDVIEVARALTGWTTQPPPQGEADSFYFQAQAHDRGPKHVLGLWLAPDRGIEDGLDLLAYLAAHPSTARRVCRALAERFVSEPSPARLVAECMNVYLATRGDLRAVTRTILFSPEFRDPRLRGTKLKRPLVFLASLLRATRARPDDPQTDMLLVYLVRLGEAPYVSRPPTGYPELSSHWNSVGAMLMRRHLVDWLTDSDGRFEIRWGPSVETSAELVDMLGRRLLEAPPAPATRAAAIAGVDALGPTATPQLRMREAGALLLASPDFMWH